VDGYLGVEPGEVVITVAEGPFADVGDRLRTRAITASIRGQKTKGGTLFGVLGGGLSSHKILHAQSYLG
jgi:hypothetical protein